VSRALIAIALVVAPVAARADDDVVAEGAVAEPPDHAVAATLGAAGGGRTTPGGLRVGGRYLHRTSEEHWFEGFAAFTFGGGSAACFRDRNDSFVCDHGRVDGFAAEVGASFRRRMFGRDQYQPYLRAGIAVRVARFGSDDVRGLALPLTAGGGVRVAVGGNIAIAAEAALELGFGWFNRGLGSEPQVGLAIAGVVEFGL
jgi:hypothetical protein